MFVMNPESLNRLTSTSYIWLLISEVTSRWPYVVGFFITLVKMGAPTPVHRLHPNGVSIRRLELMIERDHQLGSDILMGLRIKGEKESQFFLRASAAFSFTSDLFNFFHILRITIIVNLSLGEV